MAFTVSDLIFSSKKKKCLKIVKYSFVDLCSYIFFILDL